MLALLVAVGGALGAAARYAADYAMRRRWATRFPIATVAINVTGSLLLGVLTGLTIRGLVHTGWGADAVVVAGTGFCGGYTTFSTATFESVQLLRSRCYRLAVLNTVASIGLTMLAAAAGIALTA